MRYAMMQTHWRSDSEASPKNSRYFMALICVAASALAIGATRARCQEISYTSDPNATKTMTLLLKDFDPKPMLHVPEHEVPRARFPVIDVHNHVNDPGGVH